MAKNKIMLIDKSKNENEMSYISKEKGCEEICFTMALGYIAHKMYDREISINKINKVLKAMINEEKERNENGKN